MPDKGPRCGGLVLDLVQIGRDGCPFNADGKLVPVPIIDGSPLTFLDKGFLVLSGCFF